MSRWRATKRFNDVQPVTIELPSMEFEKQEKEQVIYPISGNRLYFYSDVTRDSIFSLNRQIDELTKHLKFIQFSYNLPEPAPIELHISSEGGEVFPALSTVDKILSNSVPIYTHCEGIVASAATLMSVVGKKRTISKNCCMLIHQVSSGMWGNYQQLKDEMQNLDLTMKIIKNIYFKHTNFKESDLEDMLKKDLCLEPNDCLKLGLVDLIV
jgi:ATP-dependent protease ClpP protease subunit